MVMAVNVWDTILYALACVLWVPIGVLFVECAAAFLPRNPQKPPRSSTRPKVAVLVPACNEAKVITNALDSIWPQLQPGDRLVVIADNCEDDTAGIAKRHGATVIERHAPHHRGKDYALKYGVDFLSKAPPEVVVIIDADCVACPGTVDAISRAALAASRPVQATYVLKPPRNPSATEMVSALAFLMKNVVRPAGLNRLGLHCLMTGSGNAVPWHLIGSASASTGRRAEDLARSVAFVLDGHPPLYCEEGRIMGQFPKHKHAAEVQKRQWVHGQLTLLTAWGPRLFLEVFKRREIRFLAFLLDFLVPPFSLLVLLWGAVTALAAVSALVGASAIPLALMALGALLMQISVILAWMGFGRQSGLPFMSVAAAPWYVFKSIPRYAAFIRNRESTWIKTQRD